MPAAPPPDGPPGRLPGGDRRLGDSTTLEARAAPTHAELPLPRGTEVGPYRIEDVLGAGGMGVVYTATDPRLGRRVALKLLRSTAGVEARSRLEREASAMARITHPNVVQVFDVGTAHGRLYVAMELVDGWTLQEWLQRERRSWQETVRYFGYAGRGLAAAHRAGLVHRDFKPENVLVARDGRVRVTDFGLVREAGLPLSEPGGPAGEGAAPQLTMSGALLGTPRYMAPEQFASEPVDARTDQFSFAVALYEALYAHAPFPGDTVVERGNAVLSGALRRPARPRGPASVERVLARALSRDPAARFPSVEALLVELERAASGRRRLLAGGAVAGALAVAAAIAVLTRPAISCAPPSQLLAGRWDEPVRAAVSASFGAAGLEDATDAYRAVAGALDRYTARLSELHPTACRAARAEGLRSPGMLQTLCLERRADALGALTARLASGERTALERAREAVYALDPVEECLASARPDAAQFELRPEVKAVDRELADAEAIARLGRVEEAIARAQRAVASAEALGYRGLEARALLLLGELLRDVRKVTEASAVLERASLRAEAAGDDLLLLQTLRQRNAIEISDREDYAAARRLTERARAAWERLTPKTPVGELQLRAVEFQLALIERGPAVELAERVLALTGEAYGRSGPQAAAAWNNLSLAYERDHQLAKSREAAHHSLTVRSALYGPNHLSISRGHRRLGQIAYELGDFAVALQEAERELAVLERLFGREHRIYATALTSRAAALQRLERWAEAEEAFLRAIELHRRSGETLPVLRDAQYNLAALYLLRGRAPEALALADEVLQGWERDHLGDKRFVGLVFTARGDARSDLGRLPEAVEDYRRAQALLAASTPEGHPDRAYPRIGLGAALARQGRLEEGVAELKEALAGLSKDPRAGEAVFETRLELAEALWRKGERRAAREQAQAVADAPEAAKSELAATARRWLARH